MDRVVGADQEFGPGSLKFERRGKHQITDAVDVAAVKTGNVVGDRMRMQRHLRMCVRAKVSGTLRADGPVAQRGAFGRAGDDPDVLAHGQPLSTSAMPAVVGSDESAPIREWSEWPVIYGSIAVQQGAQRVARIAEHEEAFPLDQVPVAFAKPRSEFG